MSGTDAAMVRRRLLRIYSPAPLEVVTKILHDISFTYPDAWLSTGQSFHDVWITEPLSNVPEMALSIDRRTKQDRNDALVDDFRNGTTTAELADRYGITRQRVSQLLIKAGEDPLAALAERRAASREAKQAARIKKCRVCGNPFEPRQREITCSTPCAEAWRLGRRYLDPTYYERARRYAGAIKPPNRRFAVEKSAVVKALMAVGRTDVLPPRGTRRTLNPPCAAVNRDGTMCKRHAADGSELCHIHEGARQRAAS